MTFSIFRNVAIKALSEGLLKYLLLVEYSLLLALFIELSSFYGNLHSSQCIPIGMLVSKIGDVRGSHMWPWSLGIPESMGLDWLTDTKVIVGHGCDCQIFQKCTGTEGLSRPQSSHPQNKIPRVFGCSLSMKRSLEKHWNWAIDMVVVVGYVCNCLGFDSMKTCPTPFRGATDPWAVKPLHPFPFSIHNWDKYNGNVKILLLLAMIY